MRFPTPVNGVLTAAASPAAEGVLAAEPSAAEGDPDQAAISAASAGAFRLNPIRWVGAAAGKTQGPK